MNFGSGSLTKAFFVLAGSCSPDGQQTPFLPFLEVVRGAFRITVGEAGEATSGASSRMVFEGSRSRVA